jgi:hypothetical protein
MSHTNVIDYLHGAENSRIQLESESVLTFATCWEVTKCDDMSHIRPHDAYDYFDVAILNSGSGQGVSSSLRSPVVQQKSSIPQPGSSLCDWSTCDIALMEDLNLSAL